MGNYYKTIDRILNMTTKKDIATLNQMLVQSGVERVLDYIYPGTTGKRVNGKWIIGDVEGNESRKGAGRGSCSFSLTGSYAGRFVDYATGESGDLIDAWSYASGLSFNDTLKQVEGYLGLSENDYSFSKERIEEIRVAKKEREEQLKKKEIETHLKASNEATQLFNSIQDSPLTLSPYLQKKGFDIEDFSNIESRGFKVDSDGKIYIPTYDVHGDRIWNVQTIDPSPKEGESDKKFMLDAKIKGTFFIIGKLPSDFSKIKHGEEPFLGEGFATCLEAFLASGGKRSAIVAFNTSNMKALAEEFNENGIDLPFCILQDNDRLSSAKSAISGYKRETYNPGEKAALKFQREYKGRAYIAVPEIPNLAEKGTDFNDVSLYFKNRVDLTKSQRRSETLKQIKGEYNISPNNFLKRELLTHIHRVANDIKRHEKQVANAKSQEKNVDLVPPAKKLYKKTKGIGSPVMGFNQTGISVNPDIATILSIEAMNKGYFSNRWLTADQIFEGTKRFDEVKKAGLKKDEGFHFVRVPMTRWIAKDPSSYKMHYVRFRDEFDKFKDNGFIIEQRTEWTKLYNIDQSFGMDAIFPKQGLGANNKEVTLSDNPFPIGSPERIIFNLRIAVENGVSPNEETTLKELRHLFTEINREDFDLFSAASKASSQLENDVLFTHEYEQTSTSEKTV
jgi:hypothetical protein